MASEGVAVKRTAWRVPAWPRGLLAVGLLAGSLLFLVRGWMRSGAPLSLVIDGQPQPTRTHATTVGEALRHAGLVLQPEDWVWPAPDTPLQPGLEVHVRHAAPVTLHVDGEMWSHRSHALTAGGLLAETGIKVGPGDEIWLDGRLVTADTIISPGSKAHPVPYLALRRAADLRLFDEDGGPTTVHTTAATVGQVLQERQVQLYVGDAVQPGLQERIVPGMAITIERSVAVQIEVDGKLVRTRSRAETVAGVLGQEGIALVGKDRVSPDLSAAIRPELAIRVTRVGEELAVEFDAIPFTMIRVPDSNLEIDQSRLVQEGQLGLNKWRYRVRYEDGQEVERFLEDAWVEQEPVTKTLAYGTKIIVRTLDTPDGPIEYWRKIRVYTTSYRPASCGKPRTDPRYGYTRLGHKLKKGIVAVDPTVIPLRSRMYVPGYGPAYAGDTGGAIKGKFVDLGFEDHNYESWHWWTDIYLLTPIPPASQIRWILPDWPRYPDRRR